MPFRPEQPKNTGSFLGIRPVTLISVEEVKDERFDVFLRIELLQPNSKYNDRLVIIGDYDKDEEGNISGTSSLCKKLFRLFDALEEQGGINKKGEWVDENDNPIPDFGEYLTHKYGGGTETQPKYLVYLYKKRAKDGNIYTNVYPAIFKNTTKGREDIEGFIKFVKTNGALVEIKETDNGTRTPSLSSPYKNQF